MEKKELITLRSKYLKEIRSFFESQDFLEVTTPTLVPNPGLDLHIEMFQTKYIPSKFGLPSPGPEQILYLPSSPEYHLKKILSVGLPRIFEIAHSFRNGEMSPKHEPEFLMLEWYRSPGTYQEIAKDLEKLLSILGAKFDGTSKYDWQQVDHISVEDLLEKYGAPKTLNAWMQESDFEVEFERFLVEKVERNLGQERPCFVWDYPSCFASLSRKKAGAPHLCERFELYVRGVEIANCYGELTDANEQRARCEADQKERLRLYGESPPIDEEFLESLKKLPSEVSGIAVGLDRLLQVLLQKPSVHDVLPFSQYRNAMHT